MSRAGKAAELSTCERIFICQLKLAGDNFPSSWRGSGRGPPAGLPWKPRPISSRPSFLSSSRGRGDVETCPSSFDWQMNILSQGENSATLPAQGMVILYKKSWKYKIPLFFITPYSNKDFWDLYYVLISYFGFKAFCKNVDFEIRYQTLRGPYLSQILINFKNLWHFWNQNFVGFTKKTKTFF